MPAGRVDALVGRRGERRDLDVRLVRAAQGVGGLVLVSGEAGIGKTALAEHTMVEAKRAGFDTAWAACPQTAAVAPLLPWTHLIGQLGEAHGELPDLAVDLADRDAARLEQALRVERWLRGRARSPLLVVLDDLHWADAATLSVLHHVALVVPSLPVVIVATHRPAVAVPSSGFSTAIDGLRQLGTVLELHGLGPDETAELAAAVTGERPTPAASRSLVELTGGNPLFARELSRVLPAEAWGGAFDVGDLGLPTTLQTVLAERVAAVSGACRGLLDVLSVAGDEAPLDLLIEICGLAHHEVLELADEAARAGLVRLSGGWLAFRHPLFRAAVYEALSSAARARLHDRVGTELLARRARGLTVGAAALAHHFGRAAPLGSADRAFRLAIEAATEAASMLSFDLAVRRYEQALTMLALHPDLGDRAAVLLDLADARVAAGDLEGGRATFAEAAEEAAHTNDAAALGRAALGFSGGMAGIEVLIGEPEVRALLERAADALHGDDALGARVQARLSTALSLGAPISARAGLASEARRRALASGDPAAIAEALAAWCDVVAGPDHLDERRSAAAEIVQHATATGDLRREALGRRLLVEALLESGELRAAEAEIRRFERTATRLGRSEYLWYPALWRGALALARGQADVWLQERGALDRYVATGGGNAELLATVQVASLSFDLADPALAREVMVEILASDAVIEDAQVAVTTTLLRVHAGDVDGGRAALDRVIAAALSVQPDSEWPGMMLQVVELIAAIGGHPAADQVRRALTPYGSVWAVEGIGAGVRGPLDRALGLLAALDGDRAAAEAHFTAAREAAVAAGADLVAALIDHDAGLTLDDPERLARARQFWNRIDATARLRQIEAHEATHGTPVPPPSARPAGSNVFACHGDVWTITFDSVTRSLADRKGLRDLAHLIAKPGRAIAALDLAAPGGAVAEGDTGDAIDARAREQYRARLVEIEELLDEADEHGDLERSAALAAERDALVGQLTGAYGLGGRARRAGGSAERARTAVRSRIRDALTRIEAAHPALGRHLGRSIRTGTFCIYDPDPPVEWTVELPSHTV